ncbi:recombinase [Tetragenococcus halophilus]|uniref:Recombinase n=1 Tax=Tetragenococcus halophilus TaxID=51669 RepID=A0AB35HMU2_TETHA|nr:recombinase [Tetragenococcus halophilus]MCO8297448.1 recombinase [Tetragenococcus halophilus]
MEEYENYEAEAEKIREHNEQLLEEFQQWLIDKKLSVKTVNKHTDNIDFYINMFLLYYEPWEAKEGVPLVGNFLGDWFIRKAMWSSIAQIKENIASLKKFYTFMYERGDIDKDTLVYLKETIKEDKDEWISNMMDYDFPLM